MLISGSDMLERILQNYFNVICFARVRSGAQGALWFFVIAHLLGVGFWDHLKCKWVMKDLQIISFHLIQIVGHM